MRSDGSREKYLQIASWILQAKEEGAAIWSEFVEFAETCRPEREKDIDPALLERFVARMQGEKAKPRRRSTRSRSAK